jgi:glycosyltransferase involved in cell wall biosynthesis
MPPDASLQTTELDFVIPGDPDALTGGYEYARRVVDGLRALGWNVIVHGFDASFPFPTPAALAHARSKLARIPDGATVLVDGLAFGAMPALAEAEAQRLRLVALVHHPLALETGLDAGAAEALRASEARALATARTVVTTSNATARALADYGVPAERTVVVEPGTDPAPLARGSSAPALELLCVSAVVPRKGHAVLVEALAPLVDRPWRLTCVGSLARAPKTVAALRQRIAKLRLAARVRLAGEVDRIALERYYERADGVVLATFHEGYGMALAEALAHGLPVVSTRAGAVPDTVPPEAGLLVPPGDPIALRAALARFFDEPELRASLAAGARAARERLPTWAESCARLSRALEAVARRAMSGFSAEWLRLREPADAAARSPALAAAFAGSARRIVDLATGTGANVRYLAPRCPSAQHWLAVDDNDALLAAFAPPAGANVSKLRLDLAHALDELPLEGSDLITASALLDLVSESWLRRLAERCAGVGADVLFALTYDGRIEWSPAEDGDELVRSLVNRHQVGDKGFGPALGPGAANAAVAAFRAVGYDVRTAPSDWILGAESRALQEALIQGWHSAAAELAPGESDALHVWADRRRAHVAAGRSRLRVGHLDVAGKPAG